MNCFFAHISFLVTCKWDIFIVKKKKSLNVYTTTTNLIHVTYILSSFIYKIRKVSDDVIWGHKAQNVGIHIRNIPKVYALKMIYNRWKPFSLVAPFYRHCPVKLEKINRCSTSVSIKFVYCQSYSVCISLIRCHNHCILLLLPVLFV